MAKISPIASYLTLNKAIPVRENANTWHFYSPEGLYLGRQYKAEQNGSVAYIREVYGEGLKKLFYECKVLAEKCVYFKFPQSPIGLGIIPTHLYTISHSVDFTKNTVKKEEKLRTIKNKLELIAIDENTNVGIYNIEKPFRFNDNIKTKEERELPKDQRIRHTIH